MQAVVGVASLIAALLSLLLLPAGGQQLTRCADASDCLECFTMQECVRDPKDNSGKNAHCVPCGWCTVEQHNWNAEVAGSCVALSDPSGKDGFCADPLASGFCASTICDQDDDDCICDANSCPVVSLLIHLISLQGFWLLAALLLLALVGIASACSLICNRPPPREIVLVRESDTVRGADRLLGTHSSTASEEYERL